MRNIIFNRFMAVTRSIKTFIFTAESAEGAEKYFLHRPLRSRRKGRKEMTGQGKDSPQGRGERRDDKAFEAVRWGF